jgi:hypothetical protein
MPYGISPPIHYRSFYIDPSLFSERERSSINMCNQILGSAPSHAGSGSSSGSFVSPHDSNYNYSYGSNGPYIQHSYFGNSNGICGTHFN